MIFSFSFSIKPKCLSVKRIEKFRSQKHELVDVLETNLHLLSLFQNDMIRICLYFKSWSREHPW
jgi:hypothetical protein